MGIRGDEAADYVRDFVEFRESILQGDLHGDRHSWGVIDSRPDALLVVQNEDEEEDTVELDPEGRTALLRAFQAGTLELKPKGDPFIIDDAFIIRAWTIGVIRHGFNFYGGDNYNTDEAMQIAHWGYVNQGRLTRASSGKDAAPSPPRGADEGRPRPEAVGHFLLLREGATRPDRPACTR